MPGKVITLTIDGRDVSAREDQTILDASREAKVKIPTLCHLDGLCDVGACPADCAWSR
jgi:bidirectional [NiFe] hydrogenase diaphorase subunit